jgi:hypothetical protein
MANKRRSHDVEAWTSAKKICRLTARQVEMARRLGMNPKKLPGLRPGPHERWKLPVALMALAWTTADARYRFRVASAALPVRTITFCVLATVGPLTLLTSLCHAQHWLVPRGSLLTPAAWQAILGGAFIGTFFLCASVAFVRPPVFGPRNADHRQGSSYRLPDVERQRPTSEHVPERTPAFAPICWTIAGDHHVRSWHTV